MTGCFGQALDYLYYGSFTLFTGLFLMRKEVKMTNGEKQAFFSNYDTSEKGLTKREYFAGLAMQGILCSKHLKTVNADVVAESAVLLADALLEQLEEKKGADNE